MTDGPSAAEVQTRKTRIGELTYEAGFPTVDTVGRLYDELDFQRAVLAYQYAEPLVAYNEMRVGLGQVGVEDGDLAVVDRFLDPHGVALTGNNTTIYAMSFLDLDEQGPMVVEVTAGSFGALFDLWQQPIAEVGPLGVDEGAGGRLLVVSSGYQGTVPEGYFPVRSRTTLVALFARGIVQSNDVAAAAARLESIRIYPLADADNPPSTKVVRISGKDWNSIAPEGFEYWQRVADVVDHVAADEDGAFLFSLLKRLAIAPGEPFAPSPRLRQILTDAAVFGWAASQTISMAPRFDGVVYYPGTHWEYVVWLDPGLRQQFWRQMEERTNYYFHATMAAPAMKNKVPGAGSQYLRSARDSDGEWLNGSNHYRLRVPAGAPVKQFWSATVHDYQTRSQIQTDTNIAARSSYDKLVASGDGSVELHFGPTPPAKMNDNWIKTLPHRGWFVWFRAYAPTEAFFDKSWQLPDFEKID